MLMAQARKRAIKVHRGGWVADGADHCIVVLSQRQFHVNSLPAFPADRVDMKVVQDRAQPSSDPIRMLQLGPLSKRALNAVLNQIVRLGGVSQQNPRVSA